MVKCNLNKIILDGSISRICGEMELLNREFRRVLTDNIKSDDAEYIFNMVIDNSKKSADEIMRMRTLSYSKIDDQMKNIILNGRHKKTFEAMDKEVSIND